MNRIGLHTVRIGHFGLERFGLGGKGTKKSPNPLVDVWYMSGYSNDNPPASLVGAKGNALAFRNFAFKLNSGFGVYTEDLSSFAKYPTAAFEIVKTSTKISVHDGSVTTAYGYLFGKTVQSGNRVNFKFKISGITPSNQLFLGTSASERSVVLDSDGIYEINYTHESEDSAFLALRSVIVDSNINITIEQIPSYEGYLCFDGVDDYIASNTSPILEDYTVICKRKWFNTDPINKAIASKRKAGNKIDGAFVFERISTDRTMAVNYGSSSTITLSQEDITYQTASSYNGYRTLERGTETDTEHLILGAAGPGYEFAECAIAWFALYNRTLTPEEIESEKLKHEERWNMRLLP